MHFNLTTAQSLFQSTEQFPVEFDKAWQWLDYSTKGNAKRFFVTCGFIDGVDFCSFIRNEKREVGATQVEEIYLTVECFKTWAMMSKTETGAKVRQYFPTQNILYTRRLTLTHPCSSRYTSKTFTCLILLTWTFSNI